MRAAIFYFSLPFIYLISCLPFPALYAFSDFLYIIIYHLFGYRKKVVIQNLKNSFPEKSDVEILKITKDFYSFFCDLLLETVKTLTISKKEAVKRCKIKDKSLVQKLYGEHKSIIIVMGHHGNWEWAGNSMSLETPYSLYVIYHPLSNKYFDSFIYKMRSRFGAKPIPMKDTFREMVKNKDTISATAFIADQTPAPETAYWTKFLNQDTPVFRGTGKIAKKMNYPVVFGHITRLKRGYYEMDGEVLIENPQSMTEDEISELHIKRLEQEIHRQPEIWLWSHRRWKHKRAQK